MRDTELLRGLLRVEDPWDVTEAKLDVERKRVDVRLEWKGPGRCPKCGLECPKHDHRERIWRDLDLCSDQLFLHALVPRVDCPDHGVTTVAVPWSVGRSEFTSRFERLAIALLLEMSVAAVARRLGIGWDAVEGIMMRAVERGKQRRIPRVVRHIGIDEKSVKKRHRYYTIVSDLDRGEVLWVGTGRKRESIDAFCNGLSGEQLAGIEAIAVDMWQPWSIKEHFSEFWRYRRESAAQRFFADWFRWATHSQLPEMISVAYTLKPHFANIITYIRKPITNAGAESLNSKIQMIKYRARGYRNEGRFEAAILFHCGGLDHHPAHSTS